MSAPARAPEAVRAVVEPAPRTSESPVTLVCAASALAVVAALIHLWAAPLVYVELWGYETFMWWGYAALYALVYLGLGLYGVALLRWPTQPMFLLGIGAGVTVVLLYVAGEDGREGLTDAAGTMSCAGLILILVALLETRYRQKVISALLVAGTLAWALRFAGTFS